MDLGYRLARPVLFSMDPERAHVATLRMAAFAARHPAILRAVSATYAAPDDPRLHVRAFGLEFPNPVGLAAGLDKDGEAIDFWAALGFGFVELGTVTPGDGQPGNDKPRLERLIPDEAIVNRMGFNNRGAAHLASKLGARRSTIPAGANLGKAKVTALEDAPKDYATCLEVVFDVASYVVINVSSPNTPGLRDLQAVSSLEPLLDAVVVKNAELAAARRAMPKPILLKIAPDLADADVEAAAELAIAKGLSGLIATNTTLRHELARTKPSIAGGLSGKPLGPRALDVVRQLRRVAGTRLPIVGVGGIRTADDAYARIRAGATLVQIYSALVYGGPGLVATIVRGLGEHARRDGLSSIERAIGVDA
ncbi:quinone-dependent dihydroorotate dehydrogenase [Myxococcota bacterium]|nr:quinone-dependent dihydroorotate dehydrogenase [Myxococcota bacterium]